MLLRGDSILKNYSRGKHTVRILIGIYQNQDEADAFYQTQSIEASAITEVGPFFSKDQALSWRESLINKLTNCKKAFTPENNSDDKAWYGFTCEAGD